VLCKLLYIDQVNFLSLNSVWSFKAHEILVAQAIPDCGNMSDDFAQVISHFGSTDNSCGFIYSAVRLNQLAYELGSLCIEAIECSVHDQYPRLADQCDCRL